MARAATIDRKTGETEIHLELDLDSPRAPSLDTGIGFLDHMLDLFAKHSGYGLTVRAKGDLEVDQHHTTEDIGICLGMALQQALGDKRGIERYGSVTLPMDESLVTVAIDLSGRYWFDYDAQPTTEKIGEFDSELIEHFWQSVTAQAQMNLHVMLLRGRNSHHIAEAVFKGVARALRAATAIDPDATGTPSTKGVL